MAALSVPSASCKCTQCSSLAVAFQSARWSSSSSSSSSCKGAAGFPRWRSSHSGSCRTEKLRPWKLARLTTPSLLRTTANSKADDSLPSDMSLENALKILGVTEGASFEEILRAKNAVLSKHTEDQDMAIQVEAAYDVLLMQSLMQRRAGKVVDSSIRFADVKKGKRGGSGSMGGPQWVRDALNKVPVTMDIPSAGVIGTQTAVYAVLTAWNLESGISHDLVTSTNANADVSGPVLAIGFGASLFFLRKQNVKLGKAAALALGSLVTGAVLGGAVEAWLRVDLIPVFGIGSPVVVVSEFVLISLWLSSLLLR